MKLIIYLLSIILILAPQTLAADTNSGLAYDSNILVNGDFEAGDTSSWTNVTGEEGTPTAVTDPQAGTYALSLARASVNNFSVYQKPATSPVGFYHLEAYGKKSNVSSLYYYVKLHDNITTLVNSSATNSETSYTLKSTTGLLTTANRATAVLSGFKTTGTDAVFFDSVVLKRITTASMFWDTATAAASGTYSANITVAGLYSAGIVVKLDNASTSANFVYAEILNKSGAYYLRLTKCVGGTFSTVINEGVPEAYAAGKALTLVISGTSYTLTYGSTPAAAGTKTISDAGIVDNVLCGKFATHSTPTVASFSYPASGNYNMFRLF